MSRTDDVEPACRDGSKLLLRLMLKAGLVPGSAMPHATPSLDEAVTLFQR